MQWQICKGFKCCCLQEWFSEEEYVCAVRARVLSSLKMCDLIKQRFIMDIIIAHTNYLK